MLGMKTYYTAILVHALEKKYQSGELSNLRLAQQMYYNLKEIFKLVKVTTTRSCIHSCYTRAGEQRVMHLNTETQHKEA